MTTTQQVRDWWAPPCDSDNFATIDFGDQGARITVEDLTVPIWRAVEAIFARHRYKIRKADTGAYNCRKITGGSGWSLHAYGVAVDVNWSTNPYGANLVTDMPPAAIREIEALQVDGQPVLRWGGRYSGSKDAMHFEVIVPPAVAQRFTYKEDSLSAQDVKDIKAAVDKAADRIVDAIKDGNLAQTKALRRAIWTAQGKTAEQIDELEAKLGDPD